MLSANSRTLLAQAALLLIAGCSRAEVACTEIGAPAGVAVTVEKAIATEIDAVLLTVCWNGDCSDHDVELSPGSDTIDQGCDGTDPDSVCSATAVPNGTKVGFVEVPGLPSGTVTISAEISRSGREVTLPEIAVPAQPTYPNGPIVVHRVIKRM